LDRKQAIKRNDGINKGKRRRDWDRKQGLKRKDDINGAITCQTQP
jgi:hypothetical protein